MTSWLCSCNLISYNHNGRFRVRFAGHVGHLTSEQSAALLQFKSKLIESKLYTPPSDDNTQPASHDDVTLLRFLRARKFDPLKAYKQFADTETWRTKHDVDRLFKEFDPVEFEDARRFYPRWTGRRDKDGRPIYVYRIASVGKIQQELNAIPAERRYQRIIALYEAMCGYVLPLCSKLPHPTETPISSVTTIIDLEDVSFGTMWSLRNHLQEASHLATANYPETLNVTAVVNSPSFFPKIWSWISNWFDEGTRNKIYVLGNDPGPMLYKIIDKKDLPKTYGGELEWVFGDVPLLDEDTVQEIGVMPKGPVVFGS
ncbi:CRAL/TRIO domain-containing protein [Gymnopus androsaceus JB14]|uniref:CRAL/TRIO domain-containing protein n=1 Tax=Gymnopus androsaceus JB14 TaxID=1447944 RepID=A0A6A4HX87_9AGAR|nr:CRAL/TRIO domain-containing protein [Gymnopus androsaceus JB14]